MLEFIQIETHENPDCAVIWLHGLGANGNDFVPIIPELNLPNDFRARFIFPHAPIQPVSLNNGMHMPAWYDLYGLDMDSKEDRVGLEKVTVEIDQLIEHQIESGIESKRIVLAGFSQGGALTLYAGLSYAGRHEKPLAGLLALSCYLPLHHELKSYAAHSEKSLSIHLAHGTFDDVVPIEFSKIAYQCLQQMDFAIEWKEYPCAHTVCAEQLNDIQKWLIACLKY